MSFIFKIEIYTDVLQITGSYEMPSYRRVSDTLNNRLHRFTTLSDATIAPLQRPQQAQRVPQIVVDWSRALCVATLEEPSMPAEFSTSMLPRDRQTVMFFTSVFALRGDAYFRQDKDLFISVREISDDFLPISNVSLYPLHGGSPVQRKFACVNVQAIQALYAVSLPSSSASSAPAVPPAHEAAADDSTAALDEPTA